MSTPSAEELAARKKRTMLLLAGGAVSLVLPLAGVAYLRISESRQAHAPTANVVFDRREANEAKINVSQTVAINNATSAAGPGSPAAPAGGSLGFVKGSNEYYTEKKEAPAPSTPTVAAAAPAPEPEPAPAAKTAKPKKGSKKEFFMPHLQGTKSMAGSSFSRAGGSPKPTGGSGMAGVADPKSGKGGDMADLLKNVPGGADNPEVKKLLQNQGK